MDRDTFKRQLGTVSAHIRRYGAMGKAAPTTRTMECAFETNQDHSDAMAACLLIRASEPGHLRRGLGAAGFLTSSTWTASLDRHQGKSVKQIIDEVYPQADPQELTDDR